MGNGIFHFHLGSFECIVVSDSTFAYPHPALIFFVNAPRKLASWEQYVSPYPSLVINTWEHRVLVDTGAGSVAPTTGKLIPNLQARAIAPEDIDTVILTHGHPEIGETIHEACRLAAGLLELPVFPSLIIHGDYIFDRCYRLDIVAGR